MIIFGISSKTYQLAVLSLLCHVCGNTAAHPLRRRVRRFSLFFVPLFPVGPAKYGMQCTYCGAYRDLSRDEAERLTHGAVRP
ncbi:zinc-ribbon domain-containing protein [Streptomyces sp. DSM 42041]|uniref:Zinc-ribbon domain-containing protein n=1 Tax=Streptomyces hazeniae TaxID=3075538 RepID=A0ABU2NP78_9ACTN|nr:zinc-ribbon domain-containing protein [Streptomyces sp. DSM 42041]MDT0378779.1 zinc-ribbon domain-containing protein [Streptomyces sp. DSM 42041]